MIYTLRVMLDWIMRNCASRYVAVEYDSYRCNIIVEQRTYTLHRSSEVMDIVERMSIDRTTVQYVYAIKRTDINAYVQIPLLSSEVAGLIILPSIRTFR